ncbi:MAG: inorganic phosphate transporter [Desulfobacterales bacterium]
MWKVISGIFLGWSLGANDASNVFGTGVATGSIKYWPAVWLTALYVLAGALIDGPRCMQTVGELSRLSAVDAFLCALAAGITMTLLTVLAMPASASQAIVGAVVGAGLFSGSAQLDKLVKIVGCWVFTPVGGFICGYVLYRLLKSLINRTIHSLTARNSLYRYGLILAGCYGAYSLGGNNVANVTGVYVSAGLLDIQQAVAVGGLSIGLGALTYSRRVMMTVGKGIAPLDPFSALVAVLGAAITLQFFTWVGVPVSSSQAVVGAVVGVGLVGDIRTVNPLMLAKIGLGWIMTPTLAGMLAWGFLALLGVWDTIHWLRELMDLPLPLLLNAMFGSWTL